MNSSRCTRAVDALATLALVTTLAGCGAVGDTGSVRDATDLAIDCEHDAALAALERAHYGGGLGRYLADLERVAVLRDAGRDREAGAALDAYLALPQASDLDRGDVDASIDETLANLREERRKRTGSADCP